MFLDLAFGLEPRLKESDGQPEVGFLGLVGHLELRADGFGATDPAGILVTQPAAVGEASQTRGVANLCLERRPEHE